MVAKDRENAEMFDGTFTLDFGDKIWLWFSGSWNLWESQVQVWLTFGTSKLV